MQCVSTTTLQRNPKSVLWKDHFQVILSNNKPQWMIISKEVAEYLEESWLINQIREELWEMQDEETINSIKNARDGKTEEIWWNEFKKEYDL